MAWRRALDVALLACATAVFVLGLLSVLGFDAIWGSALAIAGSVVRLAVPDYRFDPTRSAIQQWRERRRARRAP